MNDSLFDFDDYEPVTVKKIRCASCIGMGVYRSGETCPGCRGDKQLGISIWQGKTRLADITTVGVRDA